MVSDWNGPDERLLNEDCLTYRCGEVEDNDLGSRRALHWAELLAGPLDPEDTRSPGEQLLEWWRNTVQVISEKAFFFPESFMTTRFWNRIRSFRDQLQLLRPVVLGLEDGEISFEKSMEEIARSFTWEESGLMKWKQLLDDLAGLALWLPAYLHSQEYVLAAFPLGNEKVDGICESLLQSINEPHIFLEADNRKDFDERFLEFKKKYMDIYSSLHEDALHVIGLRTDEPKVDPTALRNLELLSGLDYADKSYLNRVNVMARWVRRNHCALPLRKILERYPRCYCNFNPSGNQHPAGSVAQINSAVREGICYFRTVLCGCENAILDELKGEQVDEHHFKQITALLSGDLLPIKPGTIEILNKVIHRHPAEFVAEFRKSRALPTR